MFLRGVRGGGGIILFGFLATDLMKGARDYFVCHYVQIGSGIHSNSYLVCTTGFLFEAVRPECEDEDWP